MLSTIETHLGVKARRGPADVDLTVATGDSRRAGPRTLFAAIRGGTVDGHRFIESACEAGSPAILLQDWPEGTWPKEVIGLQVDDPRRALGLCAAALHDHPSRDLVVIGLTGTNGKTSVATIIRHILSRAGLRAGMVGTTGIAWTGLHGDKRLETTHTTPDAPALQKTLALMRSDGVQAVVMELSSHALDQGRAAGLDLDVAGWTNVSRDHLDYHGSLEAYEAAKARLLTEVLAGAENPRGAVLVVDHEAVARHVADAERVIRVSTRAGAVARGDADIAPLSKPRFSLTGIDADIATPAGGLALRSDLIGAHNLENLLVAAGCALQSGVPLTVIESALQDAPAASGRMERVAREDGLGPLVFVDYAHTPDALRAALATLRPLVPAGRGIVTVFGCGGDRDTGKRGLMAAAAWEGSDAVVLTSDNPRTENPDSILDDMVAGLPSDLVPVPCFAPDPSTTPCVRLVDRRAAIAAAIAAATTGDLVLIAGKGHEMSQDVDGRKVAFDDRAEARRALLSFHAPANEPPTGFTSSGRIVKSFHRGRDTER